MKSLSDSLKFLEQLEDMANSLGLYPVICLIIGIAALWIIPGYMIMCAGRKAKLEGEWMCFLPVARVIYQLKIAGSPIWYMFLFKGSLISYLIQFLIGYICTKILPIGAFGGLLMVVYHIVVLVFTFFYFRKFYECFHFNPATGLLEILPGFKLIGTVMQAFIAFQNAIYYGDNAPKTAVTGSGNSLGGDDDRRTVTMRPAQVRGMTGRFAGAVFDISDGSPVVMGRSATGANIIFEANDTDISREHCSVRYDAKRDVFLVTDASSTGTYTKDGGKLPQGQQVTLTRGSVIFLGSSKQNSFILE